MTNTKPYLSHSINHSKAESCIKLFCFPYAGGSASIFRSWNRSLPSYVDVYPVELPGRGSRIAESLCTNLQILLEDLIILILQQQDKPFAFFGHSFGALLAFELTRLLRHNFSLEPLCLFVSGYAAPHLARKSKPIHILPDAQFIEKLRQFNGTPEEILNNTAIMEIMLPTVRADFCITETYVHKLESPLNCPITVFGGLKDSEVTLSSLEAWRVHTTGAFVTRIFPGDHFFLRTSKDLLLREIAQELLIRCMNFAVEKGHGASLQGF